MQENSIGEHGEIEFNLIFTSNNLIFEGRGFDAAVSSDFYDSLYLLVLADIPTQQIGQEMFKNINTTLNFAVDTSKLSSNYSIYGERQVKETESPGDILFSIIKESTNFEEVYDFNCNQECTTTEAPVGP